MFFRNSGGTSQAVNGLLILEALYGAEVVGQFQGVRFGGKEGRLAVWENL